MDSQAVTVTMDKRNIAIGSWEEFLLASLKNRGVGMSRSQRGMRPLRTRERLWYNIYEMAIWEMAVW